MKTNRSFGRSAEDHFCITRKGLTLGWKQQILRGLNVGTYVCFCLYTLQKAHFVSQILIKYVNIQINKNLAWKVYERFFVLIESYIEPEPYGRECRGVFIFVCLVFSSAQICCSIIAELFLRYFVMSVNYYKCVIEENNLNFLDFNGRQIQPISVTVKPVMHGLSVWP